jgi:hypothetical protein
MNLRCPKRITFTAILYPAFVIFLFWTACSRPEKTPSASNEPSLEGVWELTGHVYLHEGDTVYVDKDMFSQKIFTDSYFMWVAGSLADSSDTYGFGTYTLSGDTLTERLLSYSHSMEDMLNANEDMMFTVEIGENTYKQVNEMVWQDTVYHVFEIYRRLE